MKLSSTEPEYSLENPLERTSHFIVQSKDMESRCMVQVQAELRLLSRGLSMSVDTLEKILDSVLVLEQSLEAQS